ncbi:hypothetical protein AAG570_002776 [Ranatra chinensis]|uniref:Uncharacterized protein n=1 Tax=Ranatra chinensis TaxID=642074 RepID=A0ABD0Y4X6_9HEMI
MEDTILISSESTPPTSPLSYVPVNRVSALCAAASPFSSVSSPGSNSQRENSVESDFPRTICPEKKFSEEPSKHKPYSCRNSERLKFHFLSDSENEGQEEVEPAVHEFDSGEGFPLKTELEDYIWQQSEANGASNSEQRLDFHFISDSEDETATEKISSASQVTDSQDSEVTKKEDGSKNRPGLSKEEKKALKELKDRRRAEKMALLEKYRQMKPGECMKRITVNVDNNLLGSDVVRKALESLKVQGEIKCEIVDQKKPDCITWKTKMWAGLLVSFLMWENGSLIATPYSRRNEPPLNEHESCQTCDYGVGDAVQHKSLNLSTGCDNSPFAVKIGTTERGALSVGKPARDHIEMSLTELEIMLKMSNRVINTHQDLALYIYQFTKSIAETPYRKEVQKRDNEKSWYARGDSRDCVRIDRDLNGLTTLWVQQLCQFNKASLDSAKAIVDVYPTPHSLYKYELET